MNKNIKLAFVVQRYGQDVNGGAEELCRQIAERLGPGLTPDVLTTCARDYLTWENHYPEGEDRINGVSVLRFPVAEKRRVRAFGRLSKKLYQTPHSFADEAKWMDLQGPAAPLLLEHIGRHRDRYDLFVFFTYLYPPTYFGLPLAAEKSVLAPMAHDEAPLHLDLFRSLFHLPRGFIFNTDEERRFVHDTFRNDYLPWTIGGTGIDLPPLSDKPPEDYVLYLGRVDVEKGCAELVDFFRRFREEHPDGLRLVMAGDVKMKLPRDRAVEALGFVDAERKARLLAGARALVMPSRHESLSLVALEAWAAGIPVIASGGSPVLTGHVQRSGGGWLYHDYEDFTLHLAQLTAKKEEARAMGLAGRRYVTEHYSWENALSAYRAFLSSMAVKVKGNRADRD